MNGTQGARRRLPVAALVETVLCVGMTLGCYPPAPQPQPFPPRYQSPTTDIVPNAPATTVGLQVTRDPASDMPPRLRLVAVVRDRDGRESHTDLGAYFGTATREAPLDNEVVRVAIEHNDKRQAVRLVHRGGFIEARRGPATASTTDELILKIPVSDRVPVRAGETQIEAEPK